LGINLSYDLKAGTFLWGEEKGCSACIDEKLELAAGGGSSQFSGEDDESVTVRKHDNVLK
jgi:hypothetical protein